MESRQGIYAKRSYWLLIGLVGLQAAAIGLVIHFEQAGIRRNMVLDQRTAIMMDDIFPELFQDLATVSRKASDITQGVQDLRAQVSAVDEHVGAVGSNVVAVGRQVEGVYQNVNGFVQDRSGLLWGHSLNPYLLAGLLLAIGTCVPLSAWWIGKVRREQGPRQEELLGLGPLQAFSIRLDRLHALLEKIHSSEESPAANRPELRKLVQETERLIEETRAGLALLSHTVAGESHETQRNAENLH
jgi:hypothetical protein